MWAHWRRPGYWLGLAALAVWVLFDDADEYERPQEGGS
jgi:hypothetical protein